MNSPFGLSMTLGKSQVPSSMLQNERELQSNGEAFVTLLPRRFKCVLKRIQRFERIMHKIRGIDGEEFYLFIVRDNLIFVHKCIVSNSFLNVSNYKENFTIH